MFNNSSSNLDNSGVKKGRRYTVDITGLNHEGQGVGRIGGGCSGDVSSGGNVRGSGGSDSNGLAVFVAGVIPGERVRIEIDEIKGNYATGRLLEILLPSASRRQPFCPVFDQCGGCRLQHIDYDLQLDLKTALVAGDLRRIGKIGKAGIGDAADKPVIHRTIGMKKPLHYRNKAQYPVQAGPTGIKIGFYASKTHEVIDFKECAIQDKPCDRIKEIVREFIIRNVSKVGSVSSCNASTGSVSSGNGLSIYDEKSGEGLLRHVVVRTGIANGEVMVIIVINGRSLPLSDILVKTLIKGVPAIKSIFLNINTGRTNVIYGDKFVRIYGQNYINDNIGEYIFRISPDSFFQVNPRQTRVLYDKVLEYAGLTGNETVVDVYCGIGTIAIYLAEKCSRVYGIELSEAAIKDARQNASLNGVDNVEFIAGDAAAALVDLKSRLDAASGDRENDIEINKAKEMAGSQVDVIILDPPRKGCDKELLDTVSAMAPTKIIYVSCNPSTLSRDLNYLGSQGYAVCEVQPVDMFPHTQHVETCVLITRNEK